jgi:predicted membrane-bound spermidine synthase
VNATRPSLLFFLSGLAGLSWEMLWRSYSGFALGVSAESVALTVALMMAGMSAGAVLGGRVLARTRHAPLRILATTEAVIGLLGLLMPLGFFCVGRLDAAVFRHAPVLAVPAQIAFITVVIGPAALAMGMTVPLMRPIAAERSTSLAALYGLNALGAVVGIFVQTFVLIPELGLRGAGAVSACCNFTVALFAMRSTSPTTHAIAPQDASTERAVVRGAGLIAFSTGFVCFALEVAWFRALKAAFQSTTDSFALMLAGFLIPISVASFIAAKLRPRVATLAWVLFAGGVLVIAVNPLVDRVDLFTLSASGYWLLLGERMLVVVTLLGAPVLLIGLALPLLLDATADAARVGRLYGINTLGCVLGSIAAAWIALPKLGAYRTALLAGCAIALLGAFYGKSRSRVVMLASTIAVASLALAFGASGTRVQAEMFSRELRPIVSIEGADATVSVATDLAGDKQLIIDGFQTSGEAAQGHYMAWMGHLPMMLSPHPSRALVICFGTGQTANAVRREQPDALDIVELSPEVLAVSSNFASNEDVLADPRVHVRRTDGRTWLRRTDAQYDVITLEPMEPHFAGTNDLYSVDFYRAAAEHLGPDGVIAQWLPLHLLLPLEAASVARTFTEVFPNSALWIDPIDSTGILVGRKGESRPIVDIEAERSAIARDLSVLQVSQGFVLVPPRLLPYASLGQIISDDNQLLAYGAERRLLWKLGGNANVHKLNLDVIQRVAASQP